MRTSVYSVGLLCCMAFSPVTSPAQTPSWPSHAMTLITPAPPGGAVDLGARIVAEGIGARLGQSVVVEARPGADGIVAAQAFLSAKDPDHTFLVTFGGLLINNPVSHDKLPYNVDSDFVPVSMLATDTVVIAVSATLAAHHLPDLVHAMQERPDTVRWASAPGEPRLRFLGLLKEIGARPVFVPYKALSQAVLDLLADRIEIVVAPLALVRAHVQTGKLKLLATMAAERSPAAPDVPSVAEAGYPKLAMIPLIGVFARSGTAPEIVAKLNREIGAILLDPSFERRLRDGGLKPVGGTPQALGTVVADKLRENRELARQLGPSWR